MDSFVHLLLDEKCLELNSSSPLLYAETEEKREKFGYISAGIAFSVVLHLLSFTLGNRFSFRFCNPKIRFSRSKATFRLQPFLSVTYNVIGLSNGLTHQKKLAAFHKNVAETELRYT